MAWRFYTTSGNNATAEVRLWGYSKVEDTQDPSTVEYLADYLCKLDLTSGAKGVALAADSAILPVCNFVDTIAVAEDRSLVPGVRVISHGDEAFAAVVLDGLGYLGYILQIKPVSPTETAWGALLRIF